MKYVIVLLLIIVGIVGYYVYRPTPQVPLVPYTTWCNGEVEYYIPKETECFSITKEGERISTTTITTGIKYFGDMASTSFHELTDVVEEISNEVRVEHVTILPNREYRLHSERGEIYINSEEFDTIVENIILFLNAQKGKVFEYIDARHGSSIFYKYNEN